MKKVLLVLMSLFLFVLVGCGSSSSNSLDINVVDLSGKPVANATVILTDTTVAMGDVFEITTDENGIASFSSLKSGVNYKMEVFVNGEKVSERSNVSTDIDFLKITLDQGEPGDDGEEEAITATLKIKVEDNNGKLVEDAKVTLDNDEKHTVVTGIVTYTDIKLGKYTVKIEKAGFDVIEEEIEVTKEAETMTFKLTVQVNKFTINYINAAEDYTDYSLEITSIDGIDKNILLKSKEDSTYGIYFEYTFSDFNVESVGFAIKVGEDVVEEFTFENVKTDKTIWVKEGSKTVYTAKPVISTLTIKNDNDTPILYVDWFNDYPADSPYNFMKDMIGKDKGIKSGNSIKNIVEPKSSEDKWYVYFSVEIGELEKYYRSENPVVVGEGEDVVYVIDFEKTKLRDITDFIEKSINIKRNGMSNKEYLREIFKNK